MDAHLRRRARLGRTVSAGVRDLATEAAGRRAALDDPAAVRIPGRRRDDSLDARLLEGDFPTRNRTRRGLPRAGSNRYRNCRRSPARRAADTLVAERTGIRLARIVHRLPLR